MTASQSIGKQGEIMALNYCKNKGFTKKASNYRFKQAEIDLIVQKEELLIFMEVKSRSHVNFGYPESFVNTQKQSLYHLAANEYIQETGWQGRVRFDIVAIYKTGKKQHLDHFEDAFC